MAEKERSQLESDVIKRVRKMAKVWGISEKEAEDKARQYIPHNSENGLRAFLGKAPQNITLNSLDPAHEAADRALEQIEKEVSETYSRASKEMQEKVQKYLEKFEKRDEAMKEAVKAGTMTQDQYKQWRQGQFFAGERWKHMRDELAEDASNSNDIAKSVAYGHMPDVYAENYNYGTYEVEHGAKINTSFTLYDRQTVERLMRENPKLLPDPAAGSATALAIAKSKDLRWNRQHIQGELLQGILQGESIPDIAKRLRNVEVMNKKASMRYARTMTTAAENGGRIDSYERARKMGINVGPAWMATLDNRTRDSHRALDGETRDEKTGKFSNGCRFPGDPEGRPEEVYNCRCTLVGQLKGFEHDFRDQNWRKSELLGTMSYDEWKKVKSDTVPDFASDIGKELKASKIEWNKARQRLA